MNYTMNNNKLDVHLLYNEFSFLFWSKIFSENELISLKKYISDNGNNLQNLISDIIPSYKISHKFDNYNNIYYDDFKNRSYNDIDKSKSILAGILFIFGILTCKFIITNQDYSIIIKGGKAIQLLLSKNSNNKFISDDIDILLLPINQPYNYTHIKNLSYQISLLIKWIFNVSNNDFDSVNCVQILPFINQGYPYIDKISYKNQPSSYDLKYYTALVDIDFGPINDNITFYEDLDITTFDHIIFGKIIYKYQNIHKLFFEKLYYINYYAHHFEFICYNPHLYQAYAKKYCDAYRFIVKFANQVHVLLLILCKRLDIPPRKIPKNKIIMVNTFINKYIPNPSNNLFQFIINTHNTLDYLRLINYNIIELPKILN